MEKKRRGNERLTTNTLTTSCYYIVRVRCAGRWVFKLRIKKGIGGGDMRRGIDNYSSVSADIVEFVNKATNTSQERRI